MIEIHILLFTVKVQVYFQAKPKVISNFILLKHSTHYSLKLYKYHLHINIDTSTTYVAGNFTFVIVVPFS